MACSKPFLFALFWAAALWGAQPQAPGVANFHQVDASVFRGAQPLDAGWASLAKLGVKTVIDLREPGEHPWQAEQRAVEAAGMRYVSVPMHGLIAPPDSEMAEVLTMLEAATGAPVFVHCRRGKDRTGTVIACYRIEHDHWKNERALAEARSLGMSWTQIGMRRFILRFRSNGEELRAGTKVAVAGDR
jgi:uncharacterized protein (TIGR01244 family)